LIFDLTLLHQIQAAMRAKSFEAECGYPIDKQ